MGNFLKNLQEIKKESRSMDEGEWEKRNTNER